MFYKRSFWTCLGYITWFHLPFCLQYFLQQLRFSVSVDSIYMFWELIELKINKFEIPSIIAMVGYYTIKLEKILFFRHCDLRISMFIKWNCELCQVMLTWSIKSKKLVMVFFYWKMNSGRLFDLNISVEELYVWNEFFFHLWNTFFIVKNWTFNIWQNTKFGVRILFYNMKSGRFWIIIYLGLNVHYLHLDVL